MNKKITVFGSSVPREGEAEYLFAMRLGALLANAGFRVYSGGYLGIMDGVSRGAVESGGEAIGVIVKGWSSVKSRFLTETVICSSLFERIETLIKNADGFIVLQGGTGTLLELAVLWEFMNKRIMPVKPVACHSEMWKDVVRIMENQIRSEGRETGLLKCFDTEEDIVQYLKNSLSL